jgi:hypothetical protein
VVALGVGVVDGLGVDLLTGLAAIPAGALAAGTVSTVWHLGHLILVPALRDEICSACRQLVQAKRIGMVRTGGFNAWAGSRE